jgi:isocitrate dehydrogenase
MADSTIIYTLTDEAPMLATHSLYPILKAYASAAGVEMDLWDISLAGRIISMFPDRLTPEQRVDDFLGELGRLVIRPEANVVKLPNVSASIPQLNAVIAELQSQGFDLPDYPAEASTDEERDVQARYKRALGSAVNPVLRQGNSDRRAPHSVKNYAKAHPHRMGEWSKDSKTNVASMTTGDFYGSEVSATMKAAGDLAIEFVAQDGTRSELRRPLAVLEGEIIDATALHVADLEAFLKEQMQRAKDLGVLLSVHLKATMMKVSDPIIFGHVVRCYFPETFAAYGDELSAAGLTPTNGLGSILDGLGDLANGAQIKASFDAELARGARLAMVDSDRGITNLHVPSDVIVDASMPAMIRTSGHMWGADGGEGDTLAVIPDRCYAGVYQAAIDDCRDHGALDPATIGSVPNVGLMAQAAEEYGSHDKTFEMSEAGTVVVTGPDGVVFDVAVAQGDIFRMCQTKDIPVRDWVKLAVKRARATGDPAIFWLDENRAHDVEIIRKVTAYLGELDTEGLDISIKTPIEATKISLTRIRQGLNTISVTGNVLRDYLTDLFPILELGTSAKMLSVVPLIAGGGLFETGAGGSAPKHVQAFVKDNYLRWDSLGEFLAMAVSFEQYASYTGNAKAQVLADTLDRATGTLLENDKGPARALGGIDNRGSHFYLALYWAQELAKQSDDAELAARFAGLAEALTKNEAAIIAELNGVQGASIDLGGYYRPNPELVDGFMRPSATLNTDLATLSS